MDGLSLHPEKTREGALRRYEIALDERRIATRLLAQADRQLAAAQQATKDIAERAASAEREVKRSMDNLHWVLGEPMPDGTYCPSCDSLRCGCSARYRT